MADEDLLQPMGICCIIIFVCFILIYFYCKGVLEMLRYFVVLFLIRGGTKYYVGSNGREFGFYDASDGEETEDSVVLKRSVFH